MSIAHQRPAQRANDSGWSSLFWEAFRHSRNAMVLLDDRRRHVEVNGAYLELTGYARQWLTGRPVYELTVAGPIMSPAQWRAVLSQKQFTGEAELLRRDGRRVRVEFAGHPEVVTGRQLVLAVAIRTARGGRRLSSPGQRSQPASALSQRELEVVELIALGLSGPEIANELNLTHNTVRTHVRNAMIKSEARSRAHLVAKSMAEDLLPLMNATRFVPTQYVHGEMGRE